MSFDAVLTSSTNTSTSTGTSTSTNTSTSTSTCNDGANQEIRDSLTFQASKASLRRVDLDLFFSARKVGQLALSLFLPFPSPNKTI